MRPANTAQPRTASLHLKKAIIVPCAFLLAASSLTAALAASNKKPQLDFDALGKVAVVGAFSGIQFYDAEIASSAANTRGDPSGTVSTLLSIDAQGDVQRLASVEGSIYAIQQCGDDGTVYFGGSFGSSSSSSASANLSNIAVYHASNGTISPLGSGLDGPVHALACDDAAQTLFVAGAFQTPIGTSQGYKGAAAAWSTATRTWSQLPFGGFPGNGVAITSLHIVNDSSSATRSLLFGGNFTTYWLTDGNGTASSSANASVLAVPGANGKIALVPADGSTSSNSTTSVYPSLGSSLLPIALGTAEVSASSPTSQTMFSDPKNVLCPAGDDGTTGSTWLAQDGTVGRITARMYTPLEAGGFRLGNTHVGGSGTETFSITAIPSNQVLTLSYRTDPSSGAASSLATCSDACPLSHDQAVLHEDFLIAGTSNSSTTLTGFEITMTSHFGSAAGLHLLQLLSPGSLAYAIDTQNAGYGQGVCASGPFPVYGRSLSTHTGAPGIPWNHHVVASSKVSGTEEGMICAPTPVDTDASDSATTTWYPYIAQDGQYTLAFFTPACDFDSTCGQRGYVDVTVEIQPGSAGNASAVATTTTTINQEVDIDTWTTVFTGSIHPVSDGDQVTVTMRLSQTQRAVLAPGKGDKYYLIADKILVTALKTDASGSTSISVGTGRNGVNLTSSPTSSNSSLQYVTGTGLWEWVIGSPSLAPTLDTSSSSPQRVASLSQASAFDRLALSFSPRSTVSSIASSPDSSFVFLAGDFNYTSSGITARSVISVATAGLLKIPNGGLAGRVTGLAVAGGWLYAAGDFNSTADGTVTDLRGKARTQYASLSASWMAVEGLSTAANGLQVAALGGDELVFTYDQHAPDIWNSTNASTAVGTSAFTVGSFETATTADNGTAVFLAGPVFALNALRAPSMATLGPDGIQPAQFSFSSSSSSSSSTTSAPARRSVDAPPLEQSPSSNPGVLAAVRARFRKRQSWQSSASPLASPLYVPPRGAFAAAASQPATVLGAAHWHNASSKQDLTIIGGHFTSSDGSVVNAGAIDRFGKLLSLVAPDSINAAVTTLAVVGNDLWLAGNFTAASSSVGLTSNLAVFDLKDRLWSSPSIVGSGVQGSPAPIANAIASNQAGEATVYVAGSFSSVNGTACQSICAYDYRARRWAALGSGLDGTVTDLAVTGAAIYASGSFVANNTSYFAAAYNSQTSQWSFGDSDALPGPTTSISSDSENSVFVTGIAVGGSAYIAYWSGSSWEVLNSTSALDAAGSTIQQIQVVPLANSPSTAAQRSYFEGDHALLASGQLVFHDHGNVSSAFFDGSSWYPYLLTTTTSANGESPGIVAGMFFANIASALRSENFLAVGLVILISMAIALGVIFLFVLIALIITLSTRHDDVRSYPLPIIPPFDPKFAHDQPGAFPYSAAFASAIATNKDGQHPSSEKQQPLIGDSSSPTREGLSAQQMEMLDTLTAATAAALSAGHPSTAGGAAMSRERGYSSATSRPLTSSSSEREAESMYDQDDVEEGDNSLPLRGVRYSFSAERAEELSLHTGDMVEVLDDSDENWIIARRVHDGKQGLAPAAFLT